jgi:four helix bundle protein
LRQHDKLEAFHEADRLALYGYRITTSFPWSERFGLVSQMRRAAVSIPTNIVEGCARATQADFVLFSASRSAPRGNWIICSESR